MGLGYRSDGVRRETLAKIAEDQAMDASSDVRIVHNKLLGGWYVVRGSADTPLSGRFNSKEEAQQWLIDRKNQRDGATDASEVFETKNPNYARGAGWYAGEPNGKNYGPFKSKAEAEAKKAEIQRQYPAIKWK